MTERLDDVWTTRDYPVLREVARRVDIGERHLPHGEIAETLGMERDDVYRAALALERRGLVTLAKTIGPYVRFNDVTGAAYLITGLHPDTDEALSGLVDLLRQAADQTTDEEERSRLRRAADGLLGVSRDVMVGVMTAYATKYGVH